MFRGVLRSFKQPELEAYKASASALGLGAEGGAFFKPYIVVVVGVDKISAYAFGESHIFGFSKLVFFPGKDIGVIVKHGKVLRAL